jgi:hypothetical protein
MWRKHCYTRGGIGSQSTNVSISHSSLGAFHDIHFSSRNFEVGDKAKRQLGQEGITAAIDMLQLDVTNDDQILAVVKHVAEKYYGKLDGMSKRD